jgi:4-amino-4-deoxy-L-arabinose transferase-like glycosyltransferase
VFVVASAIYLPLLGKYGLWDPWETHYGEVSREILSRDDWISLWWAQDRWFWSKPILIFWSEALTWSASGLPFHPDQYPLHTEWVLRLPIYLQSITALLAVYAAISRVWSRRAGVLGALVLATTPYYAFLSHQAITDLPFVANMTTAIMLLVLGLVEDPERRSRSLRIGRWAFSAQHAVIALLVSVALPQILYLASRNVALIPSGFAWHRDSFMYGSAGNADVPGNFGWHEEGPRYAAWAVQPLAQAIWWFAGLALIVWMLRRERRLQQLYMFAFYGFCALAFMAKGIPGFALPGFVALVCLLSTGRFRMLFDGKLRVAAGSLVVLVLGMPWFVAMYIRHGNAFTDRLLVHDHLNRLTTGVHGDNGSIQYFIWQLGYGLFPWVGLAPLALGSWFVLADRAHADPSARAQRDTLTVMGLWFAVAFTLFSAMTTKFHHYVFPAVPPCAVLIGVLLDQLLPTRATLGPRALPRLAAALVAPVPLVLGFAGLHGDPRGVLPVDLAGVSRTTWVLQHAWPTWLCLLLIAAGALLFAFALREIKRAGEAPASGATSLPPTAAEPRVVPATDNTPLPLTGATPVAAKDAPATLESSASPPDAGGPPRAATDAPAALEPSASPPDADARAARATPAAREPSPAADAVHGTRDATLAMGALAGAIVLAFVARDLSWHVEQPPGSERLIHLFVYNYKRAWPDQFDYRPILMGFGCVSVLLTIGVGLRALRATAALALVGVSLAFAVFMLDVYMIDLSPHWSQQHLVQRYYAERTGPEQPLLAWQMNWKGENYYSGNRVHVFVELDNKKLLEWVEQNKGKTVFILLEHGRFDRLKKALSPRTLTALTTLRDGNKFLLVKTTL